MKKYSKKIISILLCLMLVFAFIPTAFAADFSGIGSKDDPYLITNAAELDLFSQKVASGENFDGKYFLLKNNITVSSEFSPIGTKDTAFEGIFDGNGKSIWGIDVSADYAGLFAFCNGAVISNVTVEGWFTADNYAGAVVAYADNTVIENCVSEAGCYANSFVGGIVGYISSGRISNCSASDYASISGYAEFTGGIAGYSGADITGCTNSSYLDGYKNVGGIAGFSSGDIISCTNASPVTAYSSNIGGIAGHAEGEIKYCQNKSGIESNGGNVGGIAGFGNNAVITECLSTGDVTAVGNYAGGIAGYLMGGSVTNSLAAASVSNSKNYAGGIFGGCIDTEVSKCIFTSSVSANASTAGAIGALSGGSVSDCYYNDANGSKVVYTGTVTSAYGVSSSALSIESSYPTLDFQNTWAINTTHALYHPLLHNIPFHTLRDVTSSQPTCDEDGITSGTCSYCQETVITVAPAFGHSYKILSSKAPSCTTEGYEDKICTVCDDSKTDIIPATGHTDENADSTCDICGSSTKPQSEKKNLFQRIIDFFKSIFDWFKNLFK
ncbi:MAG: hypothetical protein IKL10_05985 [Clostridia bacterium]|nr:hypothetical protein [Clostridia bacterium]